MTGCALLLWLASTGLPAQMLTPSAQRVESLKVVSHEPALGEEIARAARRYLHRPTQVRTDAEGDPLADSAGTVRLVVQTDSASGGGFRCRLSLSQGTAQVNRSLLLRESPSRFDLAEAIAIELPALLAQLAEQSAARNPPPALLQPPAVAMRRPLTAPQKVLAMRSVPPKAETAAHSPVVAEPESQPSPLPPTLPEPAQPTPQPSSLPAETQAKTASPAVLEPTKEPLVQPTAPQVALAPSLEPPRRKRPIGGIGLLVSGSALVVAGVGLGIETLLIAKQVSLPQSDGRFDKQLDQQGKALGTATIVLDSVGGAALLAGSIWLYVHSQRAGKAAASTKRVALLPVVQRGAAGLVSEVRF